MQINDFKQIIESNRLAKGMSIETMCKQSKINRLKYWRFLNKGIELSLSDALKLLNALELSILVYIKP